MKIKRLLMFLCVFALTACLMASFPLVAEADEPIKWIEISRRASSIQGVDFFLPDFLEEVEEKFGRAIDGEYSFEFYVEDIEPYGNGPEYKIVTRRGEPAFPYRRFTDRIAVPGPAVMKTFWENFVGDNAAPTEGMIPATMLRDAATFEQYMSLHTEGDTNPFVIKNIVVIQAIDGVERVVYEMAADPLIQNLTVTDWIEEDDDEDADPIAQSTFAFGSMGLQASHADTDPEIAHRGSAYRVINAFGDTPRAPESAEIPILSEPTPEPTPVEDPNYNPNPELGEAHPDPSAPPNPGDNVNMNGSTSPVLIVLIGLVAAAVLAATGWAFFLSGA